MKNIYMMFMRTAAVIAVAMGLSSCLEKIPGDYIPEEEGMKTFNDAEQILTGIYTAYMSSALYSGYLTLCPDI
ncbi:MAG: RagB/SusD family nutrient uptake outer membrane protein, partial [Bacteroidales bacterium]|nr:RagB/SusD family nutrient uptake outer membrane protein [Bacteroidales bacterium]